MQTATQDKLDRIKNYHTRYEVIVVDTTGEFRSILVGYTSRKSLPGLLALAQKQGAALIRVLAISEHDRFHRGGQSLGVPSLCVGRWLIQFSGRTQRQAYIEGERPFCGNMESLELVA